jgi:spermidine/putrescine transport system ATP-binding protein
MTQELIRLESVVKRYGAMAALDGVSLSIQQGEFIALLGPSGCGKTTLLRAIAGFIELTAGEVWIDGKVMNDVPPNKRPVNTVFQNYALFPHLTVAENIAFGPRRHGVARSEIPTLVAEALAMVGMEGFGERFPAQMSGGQQQRIALARAIVNKPRVLLLDEPLGALDLKLRKHMQIELKRLQEKLGITFVYVTHDQEEALVMADRIAVMTKGRIAQLGSGEEIYKRPSTRFVADFVGEANLLDCVLLPDRRLRLKDAALVLPYTAPLGAGAATVLIRPESIDLIDGAPTSDVVAVEATIRETVFVGGAIRVYASVAAGPDLVFLPRHMEKAGRLSPGDSVTIGWRPDDGRVLTE